MKTLTRRDFLNSTGALASSAMFLGAWSASGQENAPKNWYKGNLHMHSYWSDGSAFPEEAVGLYRDNGYNFVCLSDHNVFQNEAERFVDAERIKPEFLQRFQERFPEFPVESRENEGKKQYRLKTHEEFHQALDIPGQFIAIPGYEHTGSNKKGLQVHMNFVNVTQKQKFEHLDSVAETIQRNVALGLELMKDRENSTVLTLNHPEFIYYDVDPKDVLANPAVRFFELCNWFPSAVHPDAWTRESFWDTVNSFRAEQDIPLLLGTASDDTHHYTTFYDPSLKQVGGGCAGGGWIVVRAEKLSAESLAQAMHQGDFYSSTGIVLEEMSYNPDNKTLFVKVQPEEGVTYKISFVGTKKGFDHTQSTVRDEEKDRTFTHYSKEIGQTFQVIEGTEASFAMTEDFLFVRAVVTANKSSARLHQGKPEQPTAWTQPYRP